MDSTNNQNYPRAYSGYTLLESIGQGGMSAIDLAQATVTDAQYVRFVVIKRMHAHLGETDDSYIRMFQDEARISAELQHANIAQVYNFGQYDDEFFMVMEYVPGVDLRELQRGLASLSKGLPIRITLKILYDILQALDYAHHRVDTFGDSLNIVHRDVNPRNVMLSI
jgi:serine/threonine protein kinase